VILHGPLFELVTGTLNGRKGSFVLQHTYTMTKNVAIVT